MSTENLSRQMARQDTRHRCGIKGIEATMEIQLRWCGHVSRMDDTRIPKAIFYGQLDGGFRGRGAPLKCYKDNLKTTLRKCNIQHNSFTQLAKDRPTWRSTCRTSVVKFEESRLQKKEKPITGERPEMPVYLNLLLLDRLETVASNAPHVAAFVALLLAFTVT